LGEEVTSTHHTAPSETDVTTDQAVANLISVLIDKGIITKEESCRILFSRLVKPSERGE
jgi:hypothetical protein